MDRLVATTLFLLMFPLPYWGWTLSRQGDADFACLAWLISGLAWLAALTVTRDWLTHKNQKID